MAWILGTRVDHEYWTTPYTAPIHTEWEPIGTPASSEQEAKDKLIEYHPRYSGIGWRNNETRVTDEFRNSTRVEHYRVRETE